MRIAIVSIVVHQPHIDSGDEAIPGETLAICAMFGFTVASSLVKISGTLSEIQQFPALHIYRCHRLCPPWRCRMADAVSLSLSMQNGKMCGRMAVHLALRLSKTMMMTTAAILRNIIELHPSYHTHNIITQYSSSSSSLSHVLSSSQCTKHIRCLACLVSKKNTHVFTSAILRFM